MCTIIHHLLLFPVVHITLAMDRGWLIVICILFFNAGYCFTTATKRVAFTADTEDSLLFKGE